MFNFNHMVRWILCFICLFGTPVAAQEYRYVNTDNLILRHTLDPAYNVFMILHAPTRVKILPYDEDVYTSPAMKKKFYRIEVFFLYQEQYAQFTIKGYVDKRYLVDAISKVTVPGVDTSLAISVTMTNFNGVKQYSRACRDCYPSVVEQSNSRSFNSPVYKGGNPPPAPVKPKPREYHPGPRGGCYYINEKGKRVYVAAINCAGK
jgi:hypothetical protein